jgi:hypothetical protein
MEKFRPHDAARSKNVRARGRIARMAEKGRKKKTLTITQRLCGGLRSSWPDSGPGRLRTMYRRVPFDL